MVEWKFDPRTGRPLLLEVNPRFLGSLALAVCAGGVDVMMAPHFFIPLSLFCGFRLARYSDRRRDKAACILFPTCGLPEIHPIPHVLDRFGYN